MDLTMNLDAEVLDNYVKSFLPASLQEESFHRGAQMLRKELYFDMFPRYRNLILYVTGTTVNRSLQVLLPHMETAFSPPGPAANLRH